MTELYTWNRLESREAARKNAGRLITLAYCLVTLGVAIALA